jgi:hypothetical protein
MIDEATVAQIEDKLDAMSRARDKAWRLARRKQVDAAIRLIHFDPGESVADRRSAVEHELGELEDFDTLWLVLGQPTTKNSKRAARRLANALRLHVETAMGDENLSPELRRYSAELTDLRKRAEAAANQKIGSKKGRAQKEAMRRRFAVESARRLMSRYSRSGGADEMTRFVKLSSVLYSGEAIETLVFKRLIEEYEAGGKRPTTFNIATEVYEVKRDRYGIAERSSRADPSEGDAGDPDDG